MKDTEVKKANVETKENKETKSKNNKKENFENENSKSLLKRIWNIVFWVAFVLLLAIWITDFVHVVREEEPTFCLKTTVYEYEDGTTTECVGLGYKVYNYDRSSLAIKAQFSPFFVSMKE
jgi:cytoskeletal protein RodZ